MDERRMDAKLVEHSEHIGSVMALGQVCDILTLFGIFMWVFDEVKSLNSLVQCGLCLGQRIYPHIYPHNTH